MFRPKCTGTAIHTKAQGIARTGNQSGSYFLIRGLPVDPRACGFFWDSGLMALNKDKGFGWCVPTKRVNSLVSKNRGKKTRHQGVAEVDSQDQREL